jgi:hypothetical protein
MLHQHHPQNIVVWKHLPIGQDSSHPQLLKTKVQDKELSKSVSQIILTVNKNHNKPKGNKLPSYIRTQLFDKIGIKIETIHAVRKIQRLIPIKSEVCNYSKIISTYPSALPVASFKPQCRGANSKQVMAFRAAKIDTINSIKGNHEEIYCMVTSQMVSRHLKSSYLQLVEP